MAELAAGLLLPAFEGLEIDLGRGGWCVGLGDNFLVADPVDGAHAAAAAAELAMAVELSDATVELSW